MASFPGLPGSFAVSVASWRGTKAYDLLAGTPLILLYAIGAIGRGQSLLSAFGHLDTAHLDYIKVVTILSDISVLAVALVFVVCVALRPPPIARALGVMPRIAAIAGTYLALGLLLFSTEQASGLLMSASLIFVLCGSAFSAYAVFFLGRSVSLVAEARRLVTGGPYRLVRHPLYLGEQIAIAGAVLQYISPFAVFLFAVQVSFQLYRMSCEEKVLSAAFPEYADYARRTRRILPGIY